jgi:thiamine-monophosphate kinase
MDTSDGAIATLDELSRLNTVGFELRRPVEDVLHPVAVARARQAGLPPWFMLAGPHGEFELLFTIPEPAVTRFRAAAQRLRWEPLELGVVSQDQGVRFQTGAGSRYLDTLAIRDAYTEAGADPRTYLDRLWALNDPVAAGGSP